MARIRPNALRYALLTCWLLSSAPAALAQDRGPDRLPPAGEIRLTNGEALEAITLADLMDTDTPEAIAVTPGGSIFVVNLATNSLVAQTRTSPQSPIQSPASVGDFLGRNRLDIIVGTLDARLIVYEGTTLRVLAEMSLEGALSTQPTVLPMPGQPDRDAVAVNDASGAVRLLVVEPGDGGTPWRFRELWKRSVGARLSGPMAVGRLRGPDTMDLVGLSPLGEAILIEAETGQVRRHMISERRQFAPTPLLANVIGDGGRRDEVLVLQRDLGILYCFEFTPANVNPLTQRWAERLIGTPAGSPMLLQRTGDDRSMVVVVPMKDGLEVRDSATGQQIAQVRQLSLETAPSIIPRRDAFPELAWADAKRLTITNGLGDWIQGRGTTELTRVSVDAADMVRGALGVATLDGSDTAFLVGATSSGFVWRWQTQHRVEWPTRAPWETVFGNMMHSGRLDLDYAIRTRDRRLRLLQDRIAKEAALDKARSAGDWGDAVEAAAWLVNHNPINREYASALRQARLRRNIVPIALGVVTATALAGFVAFQVSVFASRRHALRKAQQATQRGLLDEARRIYERLLARRPNDPQVFLPLAGVYMAQQDYSEQTLPTYAKAYQANPQNKDMLHAYVRALLRRPDSSPEAAKAYEEALPTFPETSLLEYGLGVCAAAAGQLEAAGKRFRAALRGGHQTDEVYSALCDVYLRMKNTTAKALPVYQQQFPRRQDSQDFLEAYLLSCIDAKRVDSEVESLCHQVLQGNSSFLPAYFHLASIFLQKGAIGQAIEEIRTALRHDNQSTQGIALLAHCYLVQNRRDEEALGIFRKALANDPTDRELLAVVASVLHERGQYDAEAVEIYRRAHAENPSDTTALKALAETALLTGDHRLSITTIEALAQLGQLNQKLVRQLAQAYVRENIIEPRAEKILREAVRVDPKNLEFLNHLARVLTAQDRVDSESVPIYESVLAASPDDVVVGGQLARAYISTARYDNALRLAERLLQKNPGDDNLKRVMALASLYTNKIDEAIAEYQKILAQNPEDADALTNLALAYAQKQRTDDEAARVFARAATLSPNNELIPLAMARLCVARNDQIRAIEHYQAALKTRAGVEDTVIAHLQGLLAETPDAVRLRWFLCEMLVAFNRLREAMEQLALIHETAPGQIKNVLSALDKILAKDANNVVALAQKGRLLAESGNLPQARKALEKALTLQHANPEAQKTLVAVYEKLLAEKEDAEVRFQLGKVWYNLGEYDRAIGCFQKAAQDYRYEAEGAKALGKCFTAKGMLDLALQEYKKLVVDEETKELLYDLAQRYEAKKDFVGAKTVYRQLFAADIDYKDVRRRFEMLSGQSTDPLAFEKTNIVEQMSEQAQRRYELLEELGRGAMGIVYKAKDRELDEIVALKILPDALSNNPEAVRRFKIEARNARRLSHPNIVRIHDIGEEMGRKYISMEIVDGSDLKKRVKGQGPLTMQEFFSYSMQIADALAYAHRLGIVHRDIKPANIMLTSRGEVKVTDFGIAKLVDQTGEGTMVGAVIGTPLYMSPEQVRGIPVDARADIYSFGIMMYEFINGRPPFVEGDLAWQHINREPDKPQNCPDLLWPVLAKCLAKNKEDRWDSAELVYDKLKELKARLASS